MEELPRLGGKGDVDVTSPVPRALFLTVADSNVLLVTNTTLIHGNIEGSPLYFQGPTKCFLVTGSWRERVCRSGLKSKSLNLRLEGLWRISALTVLHLDGQGFAL